MAHHMLYHVSNRSQAFAEIRLVLVPGGALYAATNGAGHLDELFALYEAPFREYLEAFGLESGPAQLAPFFEDIRLERFEGELRVTEVEPVWRTSARARRMTAGSSRRRPRPSVPRSPTTAPSGSRCAPV